MATPIDPVATGTARRSITVNHLVGPDIDEDVWDRIVALWREHGHAPSVMLEATVVREAVESRWVAIHLVMDGPRLLAFDVVEAAGGRRPYPQIRRTA